MSKKRRRTPKRHTVHTRDPRYNVDQYGRGQGVGVSTTPKVPAEIIKDQLDEMERLWVPLYGVKQLVKVDDNTLRLCTRSGRGRNQVNIDIKYNPGTDYYDIKAHEIKRDMSVWLVYDVDGIGWENLPDTLYGITNRGWKNDKPQKVSPGTKDDPEWNKVRRQLAERRRGRVR